MSDVILDAFDGPAIPVHALTEADAAAALQADAFAAGLAKTAEFKGKSGQVLLVPGADGALDRVLFGLGDGITRCMAKGTGKRCFGRLDIQFAVAPRVDRR